MPCGGLHGFGRTFTQVSSNFQSWTVPDYFYFMPPTLNVTTGCCQDDPTVAVSIYLAMMLEMRSWPCHYWCGHDAIATPTGCLLLVNPASRCFWLVRTEPSHWSVNIELSHWLAGISFEQSSSMVLNVLMHSEGMSANIRSASLHSIHQNFKI